MSTTAIVCFCSTCDTFIKTYVQSLAIGSHGCITCGGQMEVYVAQGRQATTVPNGQVLVDRALVERAAKTLSMCGYELVPNDLRAALEGEN